MGFIPTGTQAGRYLRVVAAYTDDHGTAEEAASAPASNPIAGDGSEPEVTPPTAPALAAVAVSGPDGVTVSWQAPESDGGAPITAVHRVTVRRNGDVVDVREAGPDRTSLLITGLDPAATYRFFGRGWSTTPAPGRTPA